MKKHLHLFLILLLPICGFAQNQIKHIKIHAENVQLRLPESTAFDSITIEAPDSGTVSVIFDGNCTSSVGDRIILGAGQIPDWDTNDGNTWVQTYDSLHTISCFKHARVFTIAPGTHTYYAVGQNYVDLDGSGVASVDGNLTVIYVPNASQDESLNGLGYTETQFNWEDSVKVFTKTTIVAPVKGQIEVAIEGYVYLNQWESAMYTSNLSPAWPDHVEITPVIMNEEHYNGPFNHRKIYNVEPGSYEVYAVGKKIVGDINFNDDGMYMTLTAHFIPDADDRIIMKSELLDKVEIHAGSPEIIGQIQIHASQKGTALIECTGHMVSSLDDQVHLTLRPHAMPNSPIEVLDAQPVSETNPSTYFSVTGSQVLQEGTYTFDVVADFDSTSSGTGIADISGLYTVLFIADQVTTATEDRITTKQEELFYPNPTTGILYNRNSTDIGNHRTINVFNTNGQLVEQINQHPGQQEVNLDKLANGTYVLSTQNENTESVQVIIKTGSK